MLDLTNRIFDVCLGGKRGVQGRGARCRLPLRGGVQGGEDVAIGGK